MDALELIKTRRSTRSYKAERPEEEKIDRIIEAGRYAPSGGNNQLTRFIVIKNKKTLDRLATLVREELAKMEIDESTYRSLANAVKASRGGDYIFHHNAPVLVVTASQKDYSNNMADCACALENMMVMANAEDLGSCWINQLKWLNENEAVLGFLSELGLKEDERVYGSVALGYPDTEDGLPMRNPLERRGNPVVYID